MVSHLITNESNEIGAMLEKAKRIRMDANRVLADALALEELRRILPSGSGERPTAVGRGRCFARKATARTRGNELLEKG